MYLTSQKRHKTEKSLVNSFNSFNANELNLLTGGSLPHPLLQTDPSAKVSVNQQKEEPGKSIASTFFFFAPH